MNIPRFDRWHFLTAFFGAVLMCAKAPAAQPEDIVRIHLEALGGKERVAALSAVRATGYVLSGGKRVNFYMIAARPARLRLEMEGAGRTMVQACDGAEAPWEFDTGTWPPRYKAMAEGAAKAFQADAEFDDPLVSGVARNYTLEFAGETQLEGKKFLRVLVSRKLTESFVLLLDAETFMIAMRLEKRASPGGQPVQIVTRFDDYRPVEGVLLAHKVTVVVDNRVTQQSIIESIQPNPPHTAETFTRPKTTVQDAK